MNATSSVTSGSNATLTVAIPQPTAPSYPPAMGLKEACDRDDKPEGYYREHHKTFSKCFLDQKFDQFNMGKYSRKYMEVYLEFAHLEGVITNIEYLGYKGRLGE